MRTGTLNVWFPDRNYGFVHEEIGAEILAHFLHASNIVSGTPRTGATVVYQVVKGTKGTIAVKAEVQS